jgi:ketosteroid isomerase-like protein
MSQNVEVVRRIWEAAERGDDQAVFALYDPDIVWRSRTEGPLEGAGGVVHGHDGVRKFFRDWLEAFETYQAKAAAFIEAGDEVVVGYKVTGRGKASGMDVEMSRWNLYEIENGLVTRVDIFESRGAALEAAGLSQQSPVEIVRLSYEAFNENGLAGASEYWDPGIVWHTDPMVPEPGVYTGFDAVQTYLEGFTRAIGAWHIDTHELRDLGGNRVLSVLTVGGQPLGQTDKETQFLDWAWIVSVRKGKIIQVRSFLARDRALEAAGLT